MNLTSIRRLIHSNPELSKEESQTSQLIADKLLELDNFKVHRDQGFHSIIAEKEFSGNGPTILFRCELDALPIQETNEFEYRSRKDNISHKCGHDGHMTILLGLAKKLSENPLKSGKVILLFQSAEEIGAGAKAVLSDSILHKQNIDHVFALHNLPGYKMHSIICKKGNITPSVISFKIRFIGKTSHAGEPQNGINPAFITADLINYIRSLNDFDPDSDSFFVSAPIKIIMGDDAYGTSAGFGELGYTIRTSSESKLNDIKKLITEKVNELSSQYKIDNSIEWFEEFLSNNNSKKAFEIIKNSASKLSLEFIENEKAFSWGEDFGLFTSKYDGAMFCLGSGINTPALHNPDYDFPDELIETGVDMFYKIAEEIIGT